MAEVFGRGGCDAWSHRAKRAGFRRAPRRPATRRSATIRAASGRYASRDDVRRHIGAHAHDGGLPGTLALHQSGDRVAVGRPGGRRRCTRWSAGWWGRPPWAPPRWWRPRWKSAQRRSGCRRAKIPGRPGRGRAGRKIARRHHRAVDARLHVADPDLRRAGAIGGVEELIPAGDQEGEYMLRLLASSGARLRSIERQFDQVVVVGDRW